MTEPKVQDAGVVHDVNVVEPGTKLAPWLPPIEHRCVLLVNDEDPHYWQCFENKAALNEFIEQLARASKEAFG